MYVRMRKGKSPRLGRLGRRRGLGDDSIDWGSIITAGINQAGAVAKVAETPPMYSAVVNPITGASSVTSYAGAPGLYPGSNVLGSTAGLTSLLNSPVFLLGGLALVLVLIFRR